MSPPEGVLALLRWRFSPLLARLLVAAPFFIGACARLDDWAATVAAVAAAGMPAAPLAVGAAVVVQALGAVLLAPRRSAWLGSGLLTAVIVVAAVFGMPIWTRPSPGLVRDLLMLSASGAIIGALALAAIQAEPPE